MLGAELGEGAWMSIMEMSHDQRFNSLDFPLTCLRCGWHCYLLELSVG